MKQITSVSTQNNLGFPAITETYYPKYINLERLEYFCELEEWEFYKFVDEVIETPHGVMMIKNRGNPILGVGHLDTVQQERVFKHEGNKFFAPQLDDRLGVYLLLEVLPSMGFDFDLLLTDSEEVGQSTAQYYQYYTNAAKSYNWMLEIDRFGASDAALYQYYNKYLADLIRTVDLSPSNGSNTDIAYLDGIGISGVNFSCAYQQNHSMNAYVDLVKLDGIIPKIIDFIVKYQHTRIPFKPDPIPVTTSYSYYSSRIVSNYNDGKEKSKYNSYYSNYDVHDISTGCSVCDSDNCTGLDDCVICGGKFHNSTYVHNFGVCRRCLSNVFDDLVKEDLDAVVGNDIDKAISSIDKIFHMIGDKKW